MNTEYKGFTIQQNASGRYNVQNDTASAFNPDGYATLNTAKGAITKHITAQESQRSVFAQSVMNTNTGPATVTDPHGPDGYKLQHPAQDIVTATHEAAQRDSEWTKQRNTKGDPIHANPETAHVYAQLDYYGFNENADKRSRNKREGVYNGYNSGKHERTHERRNGRAALDSITDDYYAPNRKARKAIKLDARAAARIRNYSA